MSTSSRAAPASIPQAQGFPPVCTGRDLVLVLGSFPGKASLHKKQYYAHPHNGFWKIMGELLGFDSQVDYPERIRALNRNRVALWDVLTSCTREGSLDSSIQKDSMVVNDFELFFEKNNLIHTIFFNGALAEIEFRKKVFTRVGLREHNMELHRLPSTSPAMAALSLSEKTKAWSVILERLHTASI